MAAVTDLAWAAGFIDGDGSFSITRLGKSVSGVVRLQAQVSVTSKDIRPVTKLIEVLGGTAEVIHHGSGGLKPFSSYYHWRLRGKKAYDAIKLIEPYLVLKREQANLATEYLDSMAKTRLTGRGLDSMDILNTNVSRVGFAAQMSALNRKAGQ